VLIIFWIICMGISEEMDMDEKEERKRQNQHLIIEEMLGPVRFATASL
jgi:hypothetical protein